MQEDLEDDVFSRSSVKGQGVFCAVFIAIQRNEMLYSTPLKWLRRTNKNCGAFQAQNHGFIAPANSAIEAGWVRQKPVSGRQQAQLCHMLSNCNTTQEMPCNTRTGIDASVKN
ncbi:hypothetical protein [Hyphomicrobium sulfonivorans]|uniref:hypothetical protein n=1 Tax=Hyphomicrobium sulfonivorans TaxID=121290 RepID=UPI00156D7D9E|nr:hypothetical protein [Hyphomicrobium sulfonivorans]MBI1650860.1 hypothetical protein [Hyphomicrobium sulfonivorans]NSL72759.1 hypothetical protein [Hyphomicrobium sulfonivorans]